MADSENYSDPNTASVGSLSPTRGRCNVGLPKEISEMLHAHGVIDDEKPLENHPVYI